MSVPNALGALALLFILAMVWLRTRLHYPRAPGRALRLTPPGVRYFGALVAMLAVGWFAAPALAHGLGPLLLLSDTFTRVAWFLAVYALFIPLHRVLKARGVQVFKAAVAEIQGDPRL